MFSTIRLANSLLTEPSRLKWQKTGAIVLERRRRRRAVSRAKARLTASVAAERLHKGLPKLLLWHGGQLVHQRATRGHLLVILQAVSFG